MASIRHEADGSSMGIDTDFSRMSPRRLMVPCMFCIATAAEIFDAAAAEDPTFKESAPPDLTDDLFFDNFRADADLEDVFVGLKELGSLGMSTHFRLPADEVTDGASTAM